MHLKSRVVDPDDLFVARFVPSVRQPLVRDAIKAIKQIRVDENA